MFCRSAHRAQALAFSVSSKSFQELDLILVELAVVPFGLNSRIDCFVKRFCTNTFDRLPVALVFEVNQDIDQDFRKPRVARFLQIVEHLPQVSWRRPEVSALIVHEDDSRAIVNFDHSSAQYGSASLEERTVVFCPEGSVASANVEFLVSGKHVNYSWIAMIPSERRNDFTVIVRLWTLCWLLIGSDTSKCDAFFRQNSILYFVFVCFSLLRGVEAFCAR